MRKVCLIKNTLKCCDMPSVYSLLEQLLGSEVAEWLAHWLLVLEVPGSIPASGEENLLVRTCFPSCHLQE